MVGLLFPGPFAELTVITRFGRQLAESLFRCVVVFDVAVVFNLAGVDTSALSSSLSAEALFSPQLKDSLKDAEALLIFLTQLSYPLEELGSKLLLNEFGNGLHSPVRI